MSELRINNITDRVGSSGPIIAGVSTVTSTSHMVMPSGPTEMRGGRGTAITLGGYADPSAKNIIDKMTIATAGNATDFGDISAARYEGAAVGSATRGILSGGLPSTFTIDYVIFSSDGGANDFGDLIHNAIAQAAATGNRIRGVYGGGYTSPSLNNNMEYVTIATLGNALDYGDLSEARNQLGATSDSHGGLS